MRVLLVEDDNDLREALIETLEMMGTEVFAAVDGVDGLKQFWNLRGTLDLIITDINMPNENGIWFTREVRLSDKKVKIAVLSTPKEGQKEAILKAGATKVFGKTEIVELMQEYGV